MQAYRIPSSAHLTNKVRAEKILKHLGYDEETIQRILSLFKVRKQRGGAPQSDSEDNDNEEDETNQELRSEAEILDDLLEKLNKEEEELKKQKAEVEQKQKEINQEKDKVQPVKTMPNLG